MYAMRGCLTITLILAVLVLGMALPHFVLGDGIQQYEGDKREMAKTAMLQTQAFFAGEPGSQLTITAMRVSRVEKCPRSDPDNRELWLSAEVQLHTIFGIPHGELRFQRGGTEIIRCPLNTAECPQQGLGAAVDTPRSTAAAA